MVSASCAISSDSASTSLAISSVSASRFSAVFSVSCTSSSVSASTSLAMSSVSASTSFAISSASVSPLMTVTFASVSFMASPSIRSPSIMGRSNSGACSSISFEVFTTRKRSPPSSFRMRILSMEMETSRSPMPRKPPMPRITAVTSPSCDTMMSLISPISSHSCSAPSATGVAASTSASEL